MMFTKKNLIRIAINTLIGVILIGLWLKLVNLSEIIDVIEKVNPISLLPIILFYFLGVVFRSLRLSLLLSNFKIPFKNVLMINMFSQFLSFTIPIRAGEIIKAGYLANNYHLPFAKSVIWVFLDRLWDFLLVILLALVLVSFIPTNLPASFRSSLGLLAGIFMAVLILVVYLPDLSRKIARQIEPIFVVKSLRRIFIRFSDFIIDTASFLKVDSKKMMQLGGLTFLALIAEALTWYWLFVVVLRLDESFIRIFLGSLFNMLTFLIPAAPGYVGSAEAAGLAVFTYGLGLDKTLVSAGTVIMHVLTLVYLIFAGLFSLFTLKLDLKPLLQKISPK